MSFIIFSGPIAACAGVMHWRLVIGFLISSITCGGAPGMSTAVPLIWNWHWPGCIGIWACASVGSTISAANGRIRIIGEFLSTVDIARLVLLAIADSRTGHLRGHLHGLLTGPLRRRVDGDFGQRDAAVDRL